ncbi:hypothetical protein EDD15DRAFT_2124923, partial [Pisolithus albus]
KRKPRAQHAPYKPRKPRVQDKNSQPNSVRHPLQASKHTILTLQDWMTVFMYIDSHPGVSQDAIVQHFKTRPEGALIFDQSTLSCKLRDRQKLEARIHEYPNALSMKRQHIVTRPDVERALYLWIKHMEAKHESINGAMLVAKRRKFEDDSIGVPTEERLEGDG